ncbi:Alpha/Beta hydrolase protein [Fusarium tricinctum]|uniref:Carboxylic ester hydrolase n=1 Tax=Fusarium tricinctum TaxID=61284 RepID=A0A8K0RN05_9HYPO|nr:Alpha/Beta hydrolase protein [Fusarium tricinctum]
MKPLTSFVAAVLATCTTVEARGVHHSSDTSLTIKTTSGELTGFINSTAPDVRQFLGVPFAEPPLKHLRFQPPQRKKYAGHISAKKYAPSCKQPISKNPTVYTEHMTQFLINGGDSEDCLYLNVYTPARPTSKRLPVFIYIPGGGFTGGGADSLYKIPDKWIQKTQSHIVVTMNYRVNLFGFPNAQAAHQNVGLLDQRMVVEWTRDNIRAFGGDVDKMVLWGQSAGAGSVGMYGYSYPKDLIVKGLISDSGAPGMLVKAYGNYSDFDTLSSKVGCGKLSERKQLSCMQKVDASVLQKVYSETSTISFTPVGDNATAFSNTTDRLARGLVTKVPWIFGNNANEGAGFGAYNESGQSAAQTAIGLNAIVCPVAAEVSARAKYGYPTYRYYYTGNFSNISPLPWIGATHSAELPLLFGTHYEYRGNSTEYEWQVAEGMQSLWLSFAQNPKKSPRDGKGVTWPLYKPGKKNMAVFAEMDKKWFQLRDESLTENQCKKN